MVEAARGAGEPGRGLTTGPRGAETARYLVVAHQTVTSPELLEFVLLVPATPLAEPGAESTPVAERPTRASRKTAVASAAGP